MKETEMKINKVYVRLVDILLLCEETEHYNEMPKGKSGDIHSFIKRKFRITKRLVDLMFGDNDDIVDKLSKIIAEVSYFVESYEIPGTVKRWTEINPSLLYYDASYDCIEEIQDTYLCHQNNLIAPGLIVSVDTVKLREREKYFNELNKKYNYQYSMETMFLKELLVTLRMVFNNDFNEYIN